MRVTVFSTRPYDRALLARANGAGRHELVFLDARLDAATSAAAQGAQAMCVFVNDQIAAAVLHALHPNGVRTVALRWFQRRQSGLRSPWRALCRTA